MLLGSCGSATAIFVTNNAATRLMNVDFIPRLYHERCQIECIHWLHFGNSLGSTISSAHGYRPSVSPNKHDTHTKSMLVAFRYDDDSRVSNLIWDLSSVDVYVKSGNIACVIKVR